MKNVYVDGVFDLFHEGHIAILRQAASHGQLIVGVCSDAFTMTYKRKPVVPEQRRYAVVEACRYVHTVVRGVGKLSDEILDEYKIDLVFHGDDYTRQEVELYYSAALKRGIFRYLPYTRGISTTGIISEIENHFLNKYE